VQTYRVYFIDRANHISRAPEIIEAADDQDASEQAKRFIDGQDIELWDRGRLIARFPRK